MHTIVREGHPVALEHFTLSLEFSDDAFKLDVIILVAPHRIQ